MLFALDFWASAGRSSEPPEGCEADAVEVSPLYRGGPGVPPTGVDLGARPVMGRARTTALGSLPDSGEQGWPVVASFAGAPHPAPALEPGTQS